MTIFSSIIIACIPSLLTGIFFIVFNRKMNARDKKREEKDKRFQQGQIYLAEGMVAASSLGEKVAENQLECAQCASGKNTKSLEEAMDFAKSCRHAYQKFLLVCGVNSTIE